MLSFSYNSNSNFFGALFWFVMWLCSYGVQGCPTVQKNKPNQKADIIFLVQCGFRSGRRVKGITSQKPFLRLLQSIADFVLELLLVTESQKSRLYIFWTAKKRIIHCLEHVCCGIYNAWARATSRSRQKTECSTNSSLTLLDHKNFFLKENTRFIISQLTFQQVFKNDAVTKQKP